MRILTIFYKKLSGGFILSVGWNQKTLTEIVIPAMGIIGLIFQNISK